MTPLHSPLAMAMCLLPLAGAVSAVDLSTPHLRLTVDNGEITVLSPDPGGQGAHAPNRFRRIAFTGVEPGPETRTVRVGDTGVRTEGLAAFRDTLIEVPNGGVPVMLEPGHSLAQSFTVAAGTISRVTARIPTWHSATSGALMRLHRETPDGPVLAERRLRNVPDNSWEALDAGDQGPGIYCLVLSEPEGTIGWWCGRAPSYAGGRAFADGAPAPDMERSLRIIGRETVGQADVDVTCDGPAVRLTCRLNLLPGQSPGHRSLVMSMPWDNTGYDVSEKAVPFTRFFAREQRYLAVEQLKRWRERDGWYELKLGPSDRIEAEGTGPWDLAIRAAGGVLSWHLKDGETDLHLASVPRIRGESGIWSCTLEFLPRADSTPPDWPRFVFPDPRDGDRATRFFYDRAFSYGPVWGGAPWHEWNALTRVWTGGEHLRGLRQNWLTYPQTPEGYIHTWGATPGWPFPDNAVYDTRHFDTNARFILACSRYACWTGDTEFLRENASRIRAAMNYQLTALKGSDGLIVAGSPDVTGRHGAVGNNYWDILPFGHLDAYANIVWYGSLEAMARIEELLAANGGTDPEARPAAFYRQLGDRARAAYNRTFWDDVKGRYIGCVDVDGKRHDYGFTFVNLEAMAYGLADREQARRIYRWLETEPTSTGIPDTYSRWVFAPRANTVHNPGWNPDTGVAEEDPAEPWWFLGWRGTAYGDQCQDGGAILYTSFFDLLARQRFLGPDNAWQRWQEILDRVDLPDRLCGGPPLYRGEHPQLIDPGSVGVDIPFPESGLVPCWILYGILGVDPRADGLHVTPKLPEGMPFAEIRNVAYRGLPLTIRGTAENIVVSCDRPGAQFAVDLPLGPDGSAVFRQPPAPVVFPPDPVPPGRGEWGAQWIWHPVAENPRVVCRTEVTLDADAVSAGVVVAADDSFELRVNGREAGRGAGWAALREFDLAGMLRPGRNTITVTVTNSGGPGGLILQGDIRTRAGTRIPVRTGPDWSLTLADDPDDTAALWIAPQLLGYPPGGPWGDIGSPQLTP